MDRQLPLEGASRPLFYAIPVRRGGLHIWYSACRPLEEPHINLPPYPRCVGRRCGHSCGAGSCWAIRYQPLAANAAALDVSALSRALLSRSPAAHVASRSHLSSAHPLFPSSKATSSARHEPNNVGPPVSTSPIPCRVSACSPDIRRSHTNATTPTNETLTGYRRSFLVSSIS